MTVHVIIPWHGGNDDQRLGALGWVQHQWRSFFPNWPLTIGMLSSDSDWCKADAVHLAIRDSDAADDDILIIADADVWTDPVGIEFAVERVVDGHAMWAMPHRAVHRLSQAAAAAVLEDDLPPVEALAVHGFDRQPYLGTVGGGMTILTVTSYEFCPLDPRFVGWGQEDESWGDALRTMLGPRHRGDHDLWHLWHPPLPRLSAGVGSIQGRHLRDRYRRVVNQQDAMRALIEGGREHLIAD